MAQDAIKTALTATQNNFGKDDYIVDLEGHEKCYWLGTGSGLLGAFHFDGACTAGDGSCNIASNSMDAGFCNLRSLGWHTRKPLAPIPLREQWELHSDKVGREEEALSSNRPELVAPENA